MADHIARVLNVDEHRAADDLFRSALHQPPATDEQWQRGADAYQAGRTFGVFDDELIGTATSWDDTLVVPGGEVANAPVTGVGVRSDRTRRGVLTELMRAQLTDFAERGVVTANLHASEGRIYGRYGYGPATYARHCTIERRRADLRADLPSGGEVERLGTEETLTQLPKIYSELPRRRAGMLGRSQAYWADLRGHLFRPESLTVTVVHRGTGGADGFAVYEVRREHEKKTLTVYDLHAGSVEAFVGLWRYLLGVDLVDEIVLVNRPLDEPTALLFTDPRVMHVTSSTDETWLRLVDVPRALEAMRGHGDPLVIEVADRMLETNAGRYSVTPDAVSRTDAPADMSLDSDALAMIYLGAWLPSALAEVGRIMIAGSEVASAADGLFGPRRAPWCGTFF